MQFKTYCIAILDASKPSFRGNHQSDLVEVANVDCSQAICEADVILRKPLTFDERKSHFEIFKIRNESSKTLSESEIKVKAGFLVGGESYNLNVEVRDTSGEVTVVKSQLHPTPPINAFVG